MTSVSAAWVSATHLLKSSFQTVHYVADDREDAANSTNQLADEVKKTHKLQFGIFFLQIKEILDK